MKEIVVIAHNIRSTYNVGSIIRTSEGFGVKSIYLTGYTPYPLQPKDKRLPHLIIKLDKQISKASLGAEKMLPIKYFEDIFEVIFDLRNNGYKIYALEQSPHSIKLNEFKPPEKIAIILGREVEGVEKDILTVVDDIIEIPMLGAKESFNVSVASAIALYHIRYVI